MIFAPDGSYIPWGGLERRRLDPLVGETALPAWLALAGSGASAAFTPSADGPQFLQLSTAATDGAAAQLNSRDNTVSPPATGGSWRAELVELRMFLGGLHFSDGSPTVEFEVNLNQGTTRGCKLRADATGTYFEARSGGALTKVPLNYDLLAAGEHARPRNIEFVMRPDRWVVLFENGAVVGAHGFTSAELALAGGTVNPKPALINRSAGTARWMRLGAFGLTVCH